ncbi:hypothetical protein COE51_01215 [Bacillus pseudomycoides]|nr:hypothetical protein COE51_01215 [Bacillus pseudomycoides]
MNKGEKVCELLPKLLVIFDEHEITILDLAFIISKYCEDLLSEEGDMLMENEPETYDKYTNLKNDLDQYAWDLLTTLVDKE